MAKGKKAAKGPGFKGYVGAKTGLSVSAFWEKLFAKQPQAKLTDKQIIQTMAEEFPNAKRYTPKDVVVFRNRYNNGNLIGQTKPAHVKVAEYIECPHCKHGVRLPMWGEKGKQRSASKPKPKPPAKKKVAKKKAKAKVKAKVVKKKSKSKK